MLSVLPRTVKEIHGLRPFQRDTLQALQSDSRLIMVEAPVGAGKSYIIRRIVEDEHLSKRPIILTYPTKILMNAQVNALKREIPNIRKYWPDDPEISSDITLFEYSSDALIRYLKSHPEIVRLDKSELIHNIMRNHQFSSARNIIVTTPDVLHIIKEGWYRGSRRLEALLNGAIVVFDEFHLYTRLKNFAPLVEWLMSSIADKIVFLSATPTSNEDMKDIWGKYPSKVIEFENSIGGPTDKTFNFPLQLHFEECRYTKTDVMLEQLRRYIPSLHKPVAVIFDSVFRLRHLKPILDKEFGNRLHILEYSGMKKDQLIFNQNTVVLGTASVEVGIEMPIKSLITEASYWTSAIQRLGRVGRFENGEAVLLTRKRLSPFLKGRGDLSRDELEEGILRPALSESMGSMVSGEMFRGDSYPFLVIDRKENLIMPYSESIFAMFDIGDDFITNWQKLNQQQKKKILNEEYKLSNDMIEDILLRDKIFPFWGIVKGALRPEYENVTTKLTDDELIVHLNNSGKSYYFDRGEVTL